MSHFHRANIFRRILILFTYFYSVAFCYYIVKLSCHQRTTGIFTLRNRNCAHKIWIYVFAFVVLEEKGENNFHMMLCHDSAKFLCLRIALAHRLLNLSKRELWTPKSVILRKKLLDVSEVITRGSWDTWKSLNLLQLIQIRGLTQSLEDSSRSL